MSGSVTAGPCLQPSAQAASFALNTELAILAPATQRKSVSSTWAEFLHGSTPLSFAGNLPHAITRYVPGPGALLWLWGRS